MRPLLSVQLILGLYTIPLVNKMEHLRVINFLLWEWNISLGSFSDTIDLPLPILACINYLGGVEVGKSLCKILVQPNCIAKELTVVLAHYSFISFLLHSFLLLLLFLYVGSSSVLLCSPHHVDLPFMTSNQCHDVTHGSRIHRDAPALPFEVFNHNDVKIDPLLKGCSVLMLDIQILVSISSIGLGKELVCP